MRIQKTVRPGAPALLRQSADARRRRALHRARRIALCGALLGGGLAACEFVEPTTTNPNQVPNATLQQLFTSAQVSTFFYIETEAPRLVVTWVNQTAGTDRQFVGFDRYIFGEGEAAANWDASYAEGGLASIRRGTDLAEQAGCRVCAGIFKVHEAFLMASNADFYGDIVFSEALTTGAPALDPQLEVYQALLGLLDEAIADLESGATAGGATMLAADLNFGGDAARWGAVAHSLKARINLHLTEVDPGRFQQALAEAQQGISTADGNWLAIHTNIVTEANLWEQFTREREGYISGGATIIDLMNGGTPTNFADDDPRLAIYFTPNPTLGFVGSPPGTPPGDPDINSAQLNRAGGPASSAYDQPILSCAETRFIIAEAQSRLGNEAGARDALTAGLRCQEAFHGVTLPNPDAGLSGQALLREIIEQKYIANFLVFEAWNDFKRTCLPEVPALNERNSLGTIGIPFRLFYSTDERQANPNVPPPTDQPVRNANDPPTAPCQPGG